MEKSKWFTVETIYKGDSYKIVAYKLYCRGKLIATIHNSENLSNKEFSTIVHVLID